MTRYSQSEEDYLECLYMIKLQNKKARVTDVANALDVKMPSVVAAVRSLSDKGLVEQEKYGHIYLTRKGEAVAKDVHDRHELLYALLYEVLGLDADVAEEDACQMEHCLSAETRERIARIVEFTRACKKEKAQFLERFMHFVKTGDGPKPCLGCEKA